MKKRKVLIIIISLFLFIYAVFLMPLPFIRPLWENRIARDRMAASVTNKAIGLHKEDVITLLGKSDTSEYFLKRDGHFDTFFKIYYDENDIAVKCELTKG